VTQRFHARFGENQILTEPIQRRFERNEILRSVVYEQNLNPFRGWLLG
jgi:hypothetical protein